MIYILSFYFSLDTLTISLLTIINPNRHIQTKTKTNTKLCILNCYLFIDMNLS